MNRPRPLGHDAAHKPTLRKPPREKNMSVRVRDKARATIVAMAAENVAHGRPVCVLPLCIITFPFRDRNLTCDAVIHVNQVLRPRQVPFLSENNASATGACGNYRVITNKQQQSSQAMRDHKELTAPESRLRTSRPDRRPLKVLVGIRWQTRWLHVAKMHIGTKAG